MRGNVKDIFAWMRAVPHPSEAALMAAFDGELAPAEEAKIRAHLQLCRLCQARADQLQEGLRLFDDSLASTAAEFAIEAGLGQLISAVRKEDSPGMTPAASPLYGGVLSELSIYLGQRAAVQLLQRCQESVPQRDGLEETLAPVVIGFLGQHTGSAVLANVIRIWDQSEKLAG